MPTWCQQFRSVFLLEVLWALLYGWNMGEHPQGDYENRVSVTTFVSVAVAVPVGLVAGATAAYVSFGATFCVVWFSFMRWPK